MIDERIGEPMPQQLPNWGFMQCIMQYVHIEPGMFGLVFNTLVVLGWANQERYPSPLDFVTTLNEEDCFELMPSFLMDAVWNTIIQAWVVTDPLSGTHTKSSQLNETIRTLLTGCKILIVSFRCDEFACVPDNGSVMTQACTIVFRTAPINKLCINSMQATSFSLLTTSKGEGYLS